MKRAVDIIFSLIWIIILSPIYMILSLIIKIYSEGPILFKQKRIGLHGRPFYIYKFRTMHINSSIDLKITPEDDNRITQIGKYLRKYKLDELPQLLNVIKGDMSLVGPRPEVPEYLSYYSDDFNRILNVKPGITDLASIKYRNESQLLANRENVAEYYINTILPDKMRMNFEYINKRSLYFDFLIIIKTIKSIFYG